MERARDLGGCSHFCAPLLCRLPLASWGFSRLSFLLVLGFVSVRYSQKSQ